ncbi:MAG: MFS transporter [Pseudomonadota bacterium]
MTYPIDTQAIRHLRPTRWRSVPAPVYALGVTSLLTDVASEMVTAVLPLYFVFALQLAPLQVGLIDAVHQGAAALARLAGGWLADRWQRHKQVAAAGYGLSALCKLGWLAAGSSWPALSAVTAADRFGKGLRTPPRDALISLASDPARVGLSFGVHRAMDSFGALLGPLLAFALLAALPGAYDVVFVASFFIALAGLAALWLLVRNPAGRAAAGARATRAQALALLRLPHLRRVMLAAMALGLATVADPFFHLLLQRSAALPVAWVPLFFLATALTYVALAVPAGRLADRIGRGRVFLLGHVLLLGACGALLAAGQHRAWGMLALGLLGAYYACTDGVLMAAVSGWLPAPVRASGFALVTTATGLSRLAGSALFGLLWQFGSLWTAVATFAVALAVALLLTARTWLTLDAPTAATDPTAP